MLSFELIVVLVLLFLVSVALAYAVIEKRFQAKMQAFTKQTEEFYEKKNKRSNDIARNVLRGQITQHFVPFRSPELADISPHDMRFMGDMCDLIAAKGYTAAKDKIDGAEVEEVIFIEVKSGDAKLSAYQESFKKAVDEGRVSFRVVTAPSELGEW